MNKKNGHWIAGIGVVIVCLVLFCTYTFTQTSQERKIEDISNGLLAVQNDRENNERIENIDNLVTSAILSGQMEADKHHEADIELEKEKSDNPAIALTDAIKDALNEANKSEDISQIEIVEIESSNKIRIKEKGDEYSIRLIGVHASGSTSGLKALLDNAYDLRIETDTKKSDGEYKLVYLWDGEPTEKGSNMINIQMVFNGYAYSTYDFVHPGVIENPNIKYQSLFIDAIKDN